MPRDESGAACVGGVMLETIILATGPAEQPVLAARLTAVSPGLTVVPVQSLDDLLAIGSETLSRSRLIGFATPVIVPKGVLDCLGYGAYNFHPGPPALPGLCPAHYAIYERARRFGVTAHRMAARVDEGPIVGVIEFEVPGGCSVAELEMLSYRELARLFWEMSPRLAGQDEPLPALPVTWATRKSSRRLYAALCAIPPDIARDELERRIAAFGGGDFGMAPTVTLHGFKFRLVVEEAEQEVTLAGGEQRRAV
jgi:methionyl-tRNA formyltransferase